MASDGTPSRTLDRDELAGALADADLRVLLMCLVHATGDRRWLRDPFRPRREVQLIADERAGFEPLCRTAPTGRAA